MIRLNAAVRADLEWWHTFVETWNGVSMMRMENLERLKVEIYPVRGDVVHCGRHSGSR